MNCFATDRQGRHRASCAANRARCACLLLCVLAAASCSNDRLTAEQARQLIESSERFAAPELMTVRQQYCATVDAPDGNVSVGTSRLKALEAAGAIRVERRAAAPGECGSLPGPMRERLMVSLADGGASFHPRRLDNGD